MIETIKIILIDMDGFEMIQFQIYLNEWEGFNSLIESVDYFCECNVKKCN